MQQYKLSYDSDNEIFASLLEEPVQMLENAKAVFEINPDRLFYQRIGELLLPESSNEHIQARQTFHEGGAIVYLSFLNGNSNPLPKDTVVETLHLVGEDSLKIFEQLPFRERASYTNKLAKQGVAQPSAVEKIPRLLNALDSIYKNQNIPENARNTGVMSGGFMAKLLDDAYVRALQPLVGLEDTPITELDWDTLFQQLPPE